MGFLQNDIGPNGGRIFNLKCDFCHSDFIRKHKAKHMQALIHFCSKKCSALHRVGSNKKNGIDQTAQARKVLKQKSLDNPLFRKNITRETNERLMQQHGVSNISQLASVKEKKIASCINKYGVEHPMHLEEVKRKVLSTMKKNGSYKKVSAVELLFRDYLTSLYGISAIESQKTINDWNIDFYIKPIDVYLQIDGVYWHGLLDKKYYKQTNKRTLGITKTIDKDTKQNDWFKTNHLNLVRLTDMDAKQIIENKTCFTKILIEKKKRIW